MNTSKISFTSRQRQVLCMLSRGLTVPEIAKRLGITHHSVKDHLDNAKDRMPIPIGQRNRVVVALWVKDNLQECE